MSSLFLTTSEKSEATQKSIFVSLTVITVLMLNPTLDPHLSVPKLMFTPKLLSTLSRTMCLMTRIAKIDLWQKNMFTNKIYGI